MAAKKKYQTRGLAIAKRHIGNQVRNDVRTLRAKLAP